MQLTKKKSRIADHIHTKTSLFNYVTLALFIKAAHDINNLT
jgi:hypothetical protein